MPSVTEHFLQVPWTLNHAETFSRRFADSEFLFQCKLQKKMYTTLVVTSQLKPQNRHFYVRIHLIELFLITVFAQWIYGVDDLKNKNEFSIGRNTLRCQDDTSAQSYDFSAIFECKSASSSLPIRFQLCKRVLSTSLVRDHRATTKSFCRFNNI